MSTLSIIQSLTHEYQKSIWDYYNQTPLPFEIRVHLADWIENQNWSYNETFFQSEQLQFTNSPLLEEFKKIMQDLITQTNDMNLHFKYCNFLNLLQSTQSIEIIRMIEGCLKHEQMVINAYQQGFCQSNENNLLSLSEECKSNILHIKETEKLVKKLKALKEELNLKIQHIASLDKCNLKRQPFPQLSVNEQNQRMKLVDEQNKLKTSYIKTSSTLLIEHRNVLQKLHNIYQNLINNELKNNQLTENFYQIKELCEIFANSIFQMLQQLKNVDTLFSSDNDNNISEATEFQTLKSELVCMLRDLVSDTFIIKTQPRQVIKKETKFTATVTLLVGSVLNLHINSSVVKVHIINEQQAKSCYQDIKNYQIDSCGDIVNNTSVMEYNATTKDLSADFGNMQLKRIKRTEKRGSESVMDEKFALLFSTEFFVERDLTFNVKTLSVPVVVIVHGNQEAHAQSTIIWDNAFAQPSRIPFQVPNEVNFGRLAKVLSQKFHEAAGRHLTDENVKFLAGKIAGNHDIQDPNNINVTWFRFSKEHLEGKNFTFWEWFYAILKLTKEHLADIWRDNLVIGFLTRQRAEELLSVKPQGTFILRFNDTSLGVISMALKLDQCIMVGPISAKELKIFKIADSIRDIKQLKYLYPDIPKDEAFSKYYTTENRANNGYVRPLLRPYIPGDNLVENSGLQANMTIFNEQSHSMANYQMDDTYNLYVDHDINYPLDTSTPENGPFFQFDEF